MRGQWMWGSRRCQYRNIFRNIHYFHSFQVYLFLSNLEPWKWRSRGGQYIARIPRDTWLGVNVHVSPRTRAGGKSRVLVWRHSLELICSRLLQVIDKLLIKAHFLLCSDLRRGRGQAVAGMTWMTPGADGPRGKLRHCYTTLLHNHRNLILSAMMTRLTGSSLTPLPLQTRARTKPGPEQRNDKSPRYTY